jgi:hypothetical protein
VNTSPPAGSSCPRGLVFSLSLIRPRARPAVAGPIYRVKVQPARNFQSGASSSSPSFASRKNLPVLM